MEVIVTKIEPHTMDETSEIIKDTSDVMKEEIVEITSTPTIGIDGNLLEPIVQPILSQSERNLRQMIEDENLIFDVQKFPIIYDRTNPNYQNKEQIRYVWNIIAENANRTPDYCHKRWRYLRDYFVRQLRYHRSSTTDPNKLKRPWVLFNKLTFLTPFVAHVVDKNNYENYSEQVTNGSMYESKANLHDYIAKYQTDNYYDYDGTDSNNKTNNSIMGPSLAVPEVHDLTPELNDDVNGEDEDNGNYQRCNILSNTKKRKSLMDSNGPTKKSAGNQIYQWRTIEPPLDEHDHFLHSLAPEIRKIDSKYTLVFRNEIHNLILKYQTMSKKE